MSVTRANKALSRRLWRGLKLGLSRWRVALVLTLFVAGMTGLLYSSYSQRQRHALQVGEPSPQTYRAPVSIEVEDQIASERKRQFARNQVGIIYSSDPDLERLVVSTIVASGLTSEVQEFLIDAFQHPSGVSDEELDALIDEAVARAPEAERGGVRRLLEDRLIATAQPNMRLTEAAREATAASARPVLQQLRSGEVIVRVGDPLTTEHLRILEALGLYDPRAAALSRELLTMLGCLLMALLLTAPLIYSFQQLREGYSSSQLIFLVALLLAGLATQRLALTLAESFMVIAVVPLLMSVLVSESQAVLYSVWLALAVALFLPDAPFLAMITVLLGALSASLLTRVFRSRASLLFAGSLGGVMAGVGYSIYRVLLGGFGGAATLSSLAWILGGGVLAGLVALGLMPLAESNLTFLTDFRLMELMSPSHPLLQRLLIDAPGSYQHSLIISNLVDQAVNNIGGNAVLARVGALYHDVGKLKRPQFFAENQFSGDNPHDHISPHLSYLIITSHVRDGVELLREYKLPKALDPFVLEHHGTTVLSFFYKRALEDSDEVDEMNFRYAGPRPRSKESAVLMLADAVESASRSLAEPTQKSIRVMIDRLIEERLQDRQLAESQLNFHDIEVIANTFERMMTAIMHRRVRYPSAEEIQNLKHGRDSRRDEPLPLNQGAGARS